MKYLKIFEDFNDIDSICQEFGITDYTINSDGSIDVEVDVDLSHKGLVKLPLKFRRVYGDFDCSFNQLSSLDGSPQSVDGNFHCFNNELTSLEGGPQSVDGNFHCYGNKLINLKGSPQSVGRNFYCNYNKLISLEGSPQSLGGRFECRYNPVFVLYRIFNDYSKVELFNDYDPVRDGGVIILDRLNGFLEDIGKPKVTEVKGYKCI